MTGGETNTPVGKYVPANGTDIYYEEFGEGEPLLLLHGGTTNLNMWKDSIPTFAKYFRVVAPDSRGHGRTKNPTDDLTYRLMADDMAALIQALGLRQPLICGYSDGGQIALEMGMQYPALAKAYIVAGAFIKWSESYSEGLQEFGLQGPGVVDLNFLEQSRPARIERLRAEHDAFQGEGYWKTLMVQISRLWCTPLNYSAQDLQKMTEPTVILIGDRDDVVASVESAAQMYRMIPNAELAIAPGSDHFFVFIKPKLFNEIAPGFSLTS